MNDSDPYTRAFGILAKVAQDRSDFYRWLALAFYPPTETTTQAVHSRQMAEELQAASEWLGGDQAKLYAGLDALQELNDQPFEALQTEHELLFGKSVQHVSPRESSYRWRDVSEPLSVQSELGLHLSQLYQQYGVACEAGAEDHVAVELEYLAYLCEIEAAEWRDGSSEAARQMRRNESAFIHDHLGRWLPEFCRRVRERNPESFYGAMAVLSDAWMQIEYGAGYTAPMGVR